MNSHLEEKKINFLKKLQVSNAKTKNFFSKKKVGLI